MRAPGYCRLKRNGNVHSFDEDGICKCGADVHGVLAEYEAYAKFAARVLDSLAEAMYEELRFVRPKPPWPAWAWARAFQKIVGVDRAREHGLTTDIADTMREETENA